MSKDMKETTLDLALKSECMENCCEPLTYWFKLMNRQIQESIPEYGVMEALLDYLEYDEKDREEILEDFYSWGHNSRWSHVFEEIAYELEEGELIEFAKKLEIQYGEVPLEEWKYNQGG